MRKIFIAAIALACVFLFSQKAAAQTSEVRVLASNGIKAVVEDLRAQYERSIGHPISIEYRPTAALKQEIDAGEQFDVVIVTAESIAQMSKEGKTLGGEGTPISRVGRGHRHSQRSAAAGYQHAGGAETRAAGHQGDRLRPERRESSRTLRTCSTRSELPTR